MLKLLPDFPMMSRGRKRTAGLLACLLLAPFLILAGNRSYSALLLSHPGSDMPFAQNLRKAGDMRLSDRVEPAGLKSPQARSAFRLVEEQENLLPERQLNLTMDVVLKDMRNLENQPAAPTAALENKAASATRVLAAKECELLKKSLASDCSVISANGRLVGENAFQYQFRLAYVEKEKFGKTSEAGRYDFLASKMIVGRNITRNRVFFTRSAELRAKIYEDISRTCRKIRMDVGTCSVTAISLSSKLEPGLPMVRLTASATFARLIRKKVAASLQSM